jgi:hypothetical protein
MAVLPTKKVIFYPGNGGVSGNDPYQWDPATNTVTSLAKPGYDIFCTGHSFVQNGLLQVTGGHVATSTGLPNASFYNPYDNTWTRLPDMNAGRWYPTDTTLANGDILVVSGFIDSVQLENPLAQVWQYATGAWRDLTNALLKVQTYALLHVAPNGKVFMSGPERDTKYLDTSGTGAWNFVARRNFGQRASGSSVLYDEGKVMVMGGARPPTNTAEVIDLNAATPAWRNVNSMAFARRHHNSTLLPDGTVLVTGGTSGGASFNDTSQPVYAAELWNPATETWTTMASQTVGRFYHSSSLLLPDGRVLSAGGDDVYQTEIYSPPYLFKGARPSINHWPTAVTYGESVFIGTPQFGSITNVNLIRLASVTHSFDMNQRINRLTFSQTTDGLTVTTPSGGTLAPPGHYMLFILDGSGVPSVSALIALRTPDGGVPKSPGSLVATTISNSQLNLKWTDTSNSENEFMIERSLDGSSFTQITTVPKNTVKYSDAGLSPDTLYYYRVRANNNRGNSGYSNTVSRRTQA